MTVALFYSSVDDVIAYTGIKYGDLGLEDADELAVVIESNLKAAKSLIDQSRVRDYAQEVEDGERTVVPAGIDDIAKRMVSNMLANAVARRSTSTVRPEDLKVMMDDVVITDAIKNDLSKYPKKLNLRIYRVRSVDEIEEDEAAT